MQITQTLTRPARPAQLTALGWWPALTVAVLLTALAGWTLLPNATGLDRALAPAEPGAPERELAGLPVPGGFTLESPMDSANSGLGGAHAWARAEWRGTAAPASVIVELGQALERAGWVMEDSTWGTPTLTGIQRATLRRGATTLSLSVVHPPDAAETHLAALLQR